MRGTAAAGKDDGRGGVFAQTALVLAVASIVLQVLGFGVEGLSMPFGIELGFAAAIAAVAYAVRALRRPRAGRHTAAAITGALLALLGVAWFLFAVLSLAFAPGD